MARSDVVERNKSKKQRLAVSLSHKNGSRVDVYKKISASMMGNTNGVGSIHPHSEETIEKIRLARKFQVGERCPAWTGGKDRYWKAKAKERDNHTCQECGFSEEEIMVVDHILPKSVFPELALELDNLQTLCPNCHARKTIKEKKMRYNRDNFTSSPN